jgi:uncharacterized protein YidB (DUF937 family)
MLVAMSSDKKGGPVRRPRVIGRPRVPPGPLAELKALLYELYLQAGTPTLDEIASLIAKDERLPGNPGRDTIARIIGDGGMPPSQADVCTVAAVLARAARWDPDHAVGLARDLWVKAQLTPAVGVPLAEVTDPFALEVHRPVELEGASLGLPLLPPYVRRAHDGRLDEVAARVAGGESVIAVLVAGSSAGKTRACWEALQPLRQAGGWRLWHPYDPTRPEAVLQELPNVRPLTVVWLNETQEYLAGESGERVAAGLRAMLADPARAPVLVLGTLWPDHHAALTHRAGSQVQQVLDGTVIEVPSAFTGADLAALQKAATADVRLAWAAEHAEDGQVTQNLAGGPALLERYRAAPPTARALIRAAMDARRLGMGARLPQAFLEAAAPGYLTGVEWDALGEDWLEQALAYTAIPCKGACGPLTRIRPRPARPAARTRGDQPVGTAAAAEPLYRLADYLDQHGRAHRASQIPPAEFWSAAVHAAPGDQAALGDAAHARGLYRDAAQLHKNAAASGAPRAVGYLSNAPAGLRADPRPARWAAAHASFDHPDAVARLLDSLREAGADEQVAVLAGRAAARAPLDDPVAVAWLLDSLRRAGADEQVAVLAGRAAARAPLDDPVAVALLLDSLREAGAGEQVAVLLARDPAARAALDDSVRVAVLLDSLRKLRVAEADEQVAALAGRAAAHVSFDNPEGVDPLVNILRKAGAHEQAAALADRAAAHAPLDDPWAVARLLDSLRRAGADEQVAMLADRAAAHAPLDHPVAVAWLLDSLLEAGAHEQVAMLAGRAAARARLDDPVAVALLLDSLREAGAGEQVAVLLARDPAAHAALDHPVAVALLLDSLREAGAGEQVAVLLAGDPAAHVALDRSGPVARLLASLPSASAAGAHKQVAVLLARDPAALDVPHGVARLLDSLRRAGADEQVAALADRAAAHAPLDGPDAVALLLASLRRAGADEQAAALANRAAVHVPLDHPHAVARLLHSLREAGAHDQAAALIGRLPAAGMFGLFLEQEGSANQFRFGQEADGTPAAPWGWEDLDLWLVPQPRGREATLPIGLPSARRIRMVSLDSSPFVNRSRASPSAHSTS